MSQHVHTQMDKTTNLLISSTGPDLAGERPEASWWEASAQLLHN